MHLTVHVVGTKDGSQDVYQVVYEEQALVCVTGAMSDGKVVVVSAERVLFENPDGTLEVRCLQWLKLVAVLHPVLYVLTRLVARWGTGGWTCLGTRWWSPGLSSWIWGGRGQGWCKTFSWELMARSFQRG